MLIAESKSNEQLNLIRLTREEVEKHRSQDWFCPSCKQKVRIKNGSIKRPHFSHTSQVVCDAFSENESEEHLLGKKCIAKNCTQFDISYELEAYLPQLKQRPDVLINRTVAIEFQCSSLNSDRFNERTRQYQNNGYEVIWIVGKKFHLKKGNHLLPKKFMYYSKKIGFYYLELDMLKAEIRVNYFIQRFNFTYCFKQKCWSLKETSFGVVLDWLKKPFPNDCWVVHQPNYYKENVKKWNQRLNQKEKHAMQLQEFFYPRGYNLRQLPSEIFYPSFLTPLLEEEEWKVRFFMLDFLNEKKEGTFEELYTYVKEKIATSQFPFALISQKDILIYSISLYLSFLTTIKKITKKNKMYHLNESTLNCPPIKTEILLLPLKYVMINE